MTSISEPIISANIASEPSSTAGVKLRSPFKALITHIASDNSVTQFDQPNEYATQVVNSNGKELSNESVVNSGASGILLNVVDSAIGDLVQKYDGVILQRDEETFWARLQDTSRRIPAVEAEFDINDLQPSDRDLAVEGAPIVWTLGYTASPRKKQSIIYVRRIPSATKLELQESMKHVEALVSGIQWG